MGNKPSTPEPHHILDSENRLNFDLRGPFLQGIFGSPQHVNVAARCFTLAKLRLAPQRLCWPNIQASNGDRNDIDTEDSGMPQVTRSKMKLADVVLLRTESGKGLASTRKRTSDAQIEEKNRKETAQLRPSAERLKLPPCQI